MTDTVDIYREKIAGTNIDQRSFLSTDYFNTFNSVVMVLDMLPDMPEMIEEIEQWQFRDYCQHFRESGLDFADLAIEGYAYSPPELREAFEKKINGMRIFLQDAALMLRHLFDAGEMQILGNAARMVSTLLRELTEEGNGLIHGSSASSQADIDKLF